MSVEPAEPVTVDFDLTRAEYLAGSRLALRHNWTAVLAPVAAAVLVVIGAATLVVAYLVAGVVVLIVTAWMWLLMPAQRWRRDTAQAGPFSYRFDRSGIAITSPAGRVELPWSRVRKVVRGRDLLLLKVGASAVLVPWRAVAADDRPRLERVVAGRAGPS